MEKDKNLGFSTYNKYFEILLSLASTPFNPSPFLAELLSRSLSLEDTLHFLLNRYKAYCLVETNPLSVSPHFLRYDSATPLSICMWINFAKGFNRMNVRIAYFAAISSKTFICYPLIWTCTYVCVSVRKEC